MVMLDPPEHTAFRRLVGPGFTPRQVTDIEAEVRAFVVERVERLRERGGGDVVAELFKPLPSMVVAHYLGVPKADRAQFDGWTEAIVGATAGGDPMGAPGAVGELFAYFTALMEGDGSLSRLAHEVSALQALGFAFTMVTGGNDTTTGLLGGAAELLTARPDQREVLIGDPARIGPAVEELLRLTSPVQGLARTTTTEVELRGRTIPAGRRVLLLYGAANRDRDQFGADADELDVGREPGRSCPLGTGPTTASAWRWPGCRPGSPWRSSSPAAPISPSTRPPGASPPAPSCAAI